MTQELIIGLGQQAVLIALGPWMLQMLLAYTANTFAQMATFAH